MKMLDVKKFLKTDDRIIIRMNGKEMVGTTEQVYNSDLFSACRNKEIVFKRTTLKDVYIIEIRG